MLLKDKSSAPTLLFGITESWLQDHFTDAQVKLNGYESFRSDRCGRVGGGCILYVHEQLIVSANYSFNDRCNNLVVVYIASLHTIVAVLYRPSDSLDSNLATIIAELQTCIEMHSNDNKAPDINLIGDFNLPEFDWKTGSFTAGPSLQACKKLLQLMDSCFLNQLVMKPTRGSNTLDLVSTNKSQDVIELNVDRTVTEAVSDHSLVECILGHNPNKEIEPKSFRAVNYHHGDFESMNAILGEIDWVDLKNICDNEDDTDGTFFKKPPSSYSSAGGSDTFSCQKKVPKRL